MTSLTTNEDQRLLVIALLAGANKDPVETVESRALHPPLQHLHLVLDHQELDVLLIL